MPEPPGLRPVLVQRNAVDDLERRVARAFRAHNVDFVAGVGERLALEPDASVEGHGQVLDDDEDAWSSAGATAPEPSFTSQSPSIRARSRPVGRAAR